MRGLSYIRHLQAAAKRRRQMRRLFDSGVSKSEIARRFGVTRQRVQQVLSVPE